jgi:hypothetical protein
MKRALGGVLLALILTARSAHPQTAPGSSHVASLKGNVARVDAGAATGFGFIVGLAPRALFIATAWHTLKESSADSVTVCFPHRGETCGRATIVYIADPIGSLPGLDLAVLRVAYPEGLVWRPDALGIRPAAGQPVWFIGRAGDWYIPNEPGRTTGFDPAKRLVSYAALHVAEGVSGAPIISPSGIVAMHVESVGGDGDARGVDIHAIRERVVDGLRAQWALVPPARCAEQVAQRGVLAGREVVVHFDAERPDAGFDALARLNCLGARAIPRPEWGTPAWPGNGIRYASGELRAARAVQSVLADLGRLDTSIGNPEGGVELWVR